jgi:hypothetical protein
VNPTLFTGRAETFRLGPWLVAILLVCTLQTVWWFGLSGPDLAMMVSTPQPAPLQWWPNAGGEPMTGTGPLVQVWSPTLFAYPAAAGFSQPMRSQEIAVRPPVDRPPEMSLQLARPSSQATTGPAVELLPWSLLLQRNDIAFPAAAAPPVAAARDARDWPDLQPRVRMIQGVSGRLVEQVDLPQGSALWGGQAWEAACLVNVDGPGNVRHVLVEQGPDNTAIIEHLVRALSAWRWMPADGPEMFRIHLSYPGSPPEEVARER